jgi:hypothetical protein
MRNNIYCKIIVLFSLILNLLVVNIVIAEEVIPETPPVEIIEENLPPTIIPIHLKISSVYDNDIDVNPCDSDDDVNTPDTISAYCAIIQTNIPSVWDWSWAPGAFVTSINDINGFTSKDKDGNDIYHYWSWSLNGEEAMVGLNQYILQPDDVIELIFVDPIVEQPIIEQVTEKHSHSSGRVVKKTFSVPNAISFLTSNRNNDGSFGTTLYTDWVAVGIAKVGDEAEVIRSKISDYYINEEFKSLLLTDYERHAMALMALGIDPYEGTDINYINKIVSLYDDIQIGDREFINDDIFGLIVLSHAGYTKDDKVIKNVVSFLVSKQLTDGSWGSIDITSAGVQALYNFKESSGVEESISKAELFLRNKQERNGSFDNNSFSTSWVIQALSLDNTYEKEVNDAIDYLVEQQKDDGGLGEGETENRIWNTSYAIPAVMGLSWNDILELFSKKENIKEISTLSSGEVVISSPKQIIKMLNSVDEKKIDILKDEFNNNLLTASVAGSIQNIQNKTTIFSSVVNKIFKKIAHLLGF